MGPLIIYHYHITHNSPCLPPPPPPRPPTIPQPPSSWMHNCPGYYSCPKRIKHIQDSEVNEENYEQYENADYRLTQVARCREFAQLIRSVKDSALVMCWLMNLWTSSHCYSLLMFWKVSVHAALRGRLQSSWKPFHWVVVV